MWHFVGMDVLFKSITARMPPDGIVKGAAEAGMKEKQQPIHQ